MKVALVKLGELLPGEASRPRRMSVLAGALAAAGHDVTWWTSDWNHQRKTRRDSATLEAAAREQGFALRLLPALGYPRNLSLRRLAHHEIFAASLMRHLRQESPPDVLWCCFPPIAVARAVTGRRRLAGTRVIFDIRDLSPDVFVNVFPRSLRSAATGLLSPARLTVGRALARSDALVAVSAGYLDWAKQLAAEIGSVPTRQAVLPLGYPGPEHPSPEPAHSPGSPLQIAFSGTLGRSFDISTLIAAAELASTRRLPLRFRIAGSGDAEARLREAAQRLGNIDLVGWLDRTGLESFLAQGDVGLMVYPPGATQGLPNKIYEYMAHGLPIVNGLGGEAAAFVRQHDLGVNFAPGDPESMVSAACSMLDPTTYRRQRQAARRLFEAEYDISGIAARMVSFVESLGEGGRI